MIDSFGDNREDNQPARSWPRRIFRALAEVIVGIYVVMDALFRTLFRPISRWLSSLQLILRLEEMIASLPPYAVLVCLALPFAIAEPAKVFALYLMTAGHLISGIALMIGAYVVSILVVDRIFHAGKPKLMTIGWFAKLWTRITDYKTRLMTWMKSTAVWKRAAEMKQQMRRWTGDIRKWFGDIRRSWWPRKNA